VAQAQIADELLETVTTLALAHQQQPRLR